MSSVSYHAARPLDAFVHFVCYFKYSRWAYVWRVAIISFATARWKVMHDDYPSHYGDAISENDDAGTGDVYLQCCLFGEVIYG